MPATSNQILRTNGAGADPSWSDLSDLLDAVFSSAQGSILSCGATGWTALAPGAAGGLLQNGGAASNISWTSPGQVVGTATSDNASQGNIGEYVSSTVAEANGISLTDGVAFNITSIFLTAGDWDVWASVTVDQGAGNNGNLINLATTITTTSGAIADLSTGALGAGQDPSPKSGAQRAIYDLNVTRFSLSVTTTIYLVARADYANTSVPGTGYGTIAARRAR